MTPHDTLARYVAAMNDTDVEAMLALYAEDAVVFDSYDAWSYVGREAWRESLVVWFSSMRAGGWTEVRDLRIEEGADVAVAFGTLHYGADSVDGETVRLFTRLTLVMRLVEGEWLICNEHNSVPLDTNTFRPVPHPESLPPLPDWVEEQ